MNTHADKLNKNKNQAVANAVAQKKEVKQTVQLEDNRPEAVAQLKAQNILETAQLKDSQSSFPVTQLVHKHAEVMKKRGRFKRSLKTAIRRIIAIKAAGPATARQIEIHDEVLHAGAHHGVRPVTVQQLVTDLNDKIAELTAQNLHDSDDK
ncbi:hypothetical protein [Kordia sp.]|uniref:hypothetical protein n=1 Tax=Kordia sp. TaxID=1965332 RepID=UPI003D6B0B1B